MNVPVFRAVRLSTIPGNYTVVYQDGESHIVDMDEWSTGPLSAQTPICGKAVPVGVNTHLDTLIVDCLGCISVVSEGR